MKKISMAVASAFLVTNLIGCADMTKQDVGVLTGGAIGGILGSQIGSGSGQILATVGGTVLGAFIGGSIGRNMDDVDRMKMSRAFESTPTDQVTCWHNPDNGNYYAVRPTRTYQRGSQPCREFTTRATIGGKRETIYGTACRKADGSWKVVQQD